MDTKTLTPEFLEECIESTGIELIRAHQWTGSPIHSPKCGCLTVALAAKLSGKPLEEVAKDCPGGPRGALYLSLLAHLDIREVWALKDGYEGLPATPEGVEDDGRVHAFEAGPLPSHEFTHLFELGRAMAEKHFGPLEACDFADPHGYEGDNQD